MKEEEEKEKVLQAFRKLWKYGHPMFFDLVIEICKVHEIKNKGYGMGNATGNFRECERIGVPAWKGCLVRMTDKITRIYNLTSKLEDPEYQDAIRMESIEDTLLDLANYCLLCLILLRERNQEGDPSREGERPHRCCQAQDGGSSRE